METCTSSMSSSSSISVKHASYIDSEKLPGEIPHQPRVHRKDCSSSLHSVRKAPAGMIKKPLTTTKMHIAPFPPMKTKVYKVKPADFKEVVQKLTGVLPCSQPCRLRSVAPSPLNLEIIAPLLTSSSDHTSNNYKADMEVAANNSLSPLSALYKELMDSAATGSGSWFSDNNVSPTTTWFSIPFQSPGTTLSVLEHNAAAL